MTRRQYNTVLERLEEQIGDSSPDGWVFHVCYGDEGNLAVFEIWESKEAQEAFGTILMPIIKEVGIRMDVEPQTFPVERAVDQSGTVLTELVGAAA